MATHHTYFNFISADHNVQSLAFGIGVGVVVAAVGSLVKSRLSADTLDAEVIPSKKITVFSLLDVGIEAFLGFQDSVMGKRGRRYFPFIATLFFFIFFSNLLGLVPGTPAITGSVSITVGLALASFVYFNFHGIREHGVLKYIAHFMGPLIWVAPIIFPVEIFSTVLRILTLNLRLYWNMNADHMVVDSLTGFLGPFALPIYLLGTFVCFVQAFVFATLSMVYINLATAHEDDH